MTSQTEFVRLVGTERRHGPTLESVSRHWQDKNERFLFISPHDDDVVMGAGLFIQLAREIHVPVYVMIVTDGAMGYCSDAERDTISDIRQKEAFTCYRQLGIPDENIIWLGFPDCDLNSCRGRRKVNADCPGAIEGYFGMQNSFTKIIRDIRPTQCFLPTSSDLHPDHKMVHAEFLISMFHAAGNIWPELGAPIEKVPYVHEMGVYCDFPEKPDLRLQSSDAMLEAKLSAIMAFKSQKQISVLIDIVRQSGPYEYFRSLKYQLYQPTKYYDRFEKKDHIPFVR